MRFATVPVRSLIAAGIGLAAVGAAAPPSSPAPRSAPNLRLAAAVRPAVAAPESARPVRTAPEGAYWHVRTLFTMTHPRQLGRGSNRYWVEEWGISETWTSRDTKSWFGYRELGVRLKSAADEAAWRRDGSPATWRRTADGMTVSLAIAPDKGRVTPVKGQVNAFILVDQRLTYEELQRLPADPAALKAWIDKAVRVPHADPRARVPEESVDGHVTGALFSLLYDLPVPKEVRTAAYRALPTMPGVRPLGKVKDSRGRTGEGFSIVRRYKGDHVVTRQMIVDTDAMVLLAENVKTTIGGKVFPNKTSTQTMLHVGWTDTPPAVPALP
ncbi:hypothetical protein ACFFMN_02490 [Planobispora siamensis]|uniref:Uncharacterized protein n=1 Tax=Planobispora siamensis TaxID=936338 RepID=A0A8J3SIV9_9ACTN|nr:hypothetical protein [Planobispora siamensis]GIH93024.1 hypothetical protein Psi01_36540 [Planobispora siamensis]